MSESNGSRGRLEFEKHSSRLTRLSAAVSYTVAAIENRNTEIEKRWLEPETQGAFAEALRSIQDLSDPKPTEAEVAEALKTAISPSESAKRIVLSFGLVSLCTELETYIAHLVTTLLKANPDRLKSSASDKNLSTLEILDCDSYDSVLQRLRDKVVKETINANPRKMLVKYVGERFDLFVEHEFIYDSRSNLVLKSLQTQDHAPREVRWGLEQAVEAFDKRHAIVHEGQLAVEEVDYFNSVSFGFSWIQTFLAARAIEKYDLKIDDVVLFAFEAAFHGVPLERLKGRL